MTSSEERREVAQKIREYADSHGDRIHDAEMVLLATVRHVESDGAVVRPTSEAELLTMLADLIDPTCNIDVIDTGERADYDCREHIMHCKNCGAEFGYVLFSEDGDVSMDDKPNYCPCCGTRVVIAYGR